MKLLNRLNQALVIVTLLISANTFSQFEIVPSNLTATKFERLDKDTKDLYSTIVSKEVVEVYPRYEAIFENQAIEKAASAGEIFMTIDKILALGQKIWKIVEAGRPVQSSSFAKPVSIIPNLSDVNSTFSSMSNWKMPLVKSFKVSYRNGFGSEVISFIYTVVFQYGGKYEGKGAYITGLFVSASNISVSWGFKFDATSEIMSIANQGSVDSPVASAVVKIAYKVSSPLKAINESDIFYVNGDGFLQRMN